MKKNHTVRLATLALSCAALFFTLVGCGKDYLKVDLTKYIYINIYPENGQYVFASNYDSYTLMQDISAALGVEQNSPDMLALSSDISTDLIRSGKLDSVLANGKKVSGTIESKNNVETSYGVKFTTGTLTRTIEHLPDLTETMLDDLAPDVLASFDQHAIRAGISSVYFGASDVRNLSVDSFLLSLKGEGSDAAIYLTLSYEVEHPMGTFSLDSNYITYQFDGETWSIQSFYPRQSGFVATPEGIYEGTEEGIAPQGTCSARYVISKNADGAYMADITWNSDRYNDTMDVITASLPLTFVSDENAPHFLIENDGTLTNLLGHSPYETRRLDIDFTTNGFCSSGSNDIRLERR